MIFAFVDKGKDKDEDKEGGTQTVQFVSRRSYLSLLAIRYSFKPGIFRRLGHCDSMVMPRRS